MISHLDLIGIVVGGRGEAHLLAPAQQLGVVLVQHIVVAVEVGVLGLQPGLAAGDFLQPVAFLGGVGDLPLQRGDHRFLLEQLHVHLLVHRVGHGAWRFARAILRHRRRRLLRRGGGGGLEGGDQVAGGDHLGMLLGVAQPQLGQPGLGLGELLVSSAAEPGRHGVSESSASVAGMVDISRRIMSRLVSTSFSWPSSASVLSARGLQPRHAGIRGQQVDVLGAELGPPRLGLAQLPLVLGDLLLQERPAVLHVGAVGADLALDEDRQDALHHVVGQLGCGVAVGDGEQVAGLRRDLDGWWPGRRPAAPGRPGR